MPTPRSLFIAFLLLHSPLAHGDEDASRFDPPHQGSTLGVTIAFADDGLRVDRVEKSGAADRAGIETGDLLVALGQWRTGGDLSAYLADLPPEQVAVRLRRDGEAVELAVDLDPGLAGTALEVARRIGRHRLFRRAEAGELDSLRKDLLAAVRATTTREAAYAAINERIDRFSLSHTAVLTPWVVENLFGEGEHYHLGMFLQATEVGGETRNFVRSLMYGSPARRAGLRVGDEIVSVDGTPIARSPRLTLAGFEARHRMSAIQVDRGETVAVAFRRRAGGKVRRVDITADRALDAVASARGSVRLIDGIGYIHFWNVMSKDNITVLEEALAGELADADALAIDLRGRGGQVSVINALANIIGREDRPVALLIDRKARSAKEMLAQRLKGRSGITLVGETTAGAVLPAHFHDLPSGAQLMLPAPIGDATIRLFTRGKRLEGAGAAPDVRVDAPLPYRAGRDVILERATSLLRKQAAEAIARL